MSLDGFIAVPVTRWTRTWEVGDRMEAEEPGSSDYPFSGPMFFLTHRPLEPPDPEVTILPGDRARIAGPFAAGSQSCPAPRAS